MMSMSPDFDSIKQTNVYAEEYWSARDLGPLLGYVEWRNFEKVIRKAIEACKLAQQDASKHFVPTNPLILIGCGGKREVVNYHFTSYALHLVLSFANSQKSRVMQAIAYFTLASLTHTNYLDIAQQLHISIPSDIATTIEQKTIGEIRRAFKHLTSISQYRVDSYRIDLYFPNELIAVECDEGGHRRYLPSEEHFRQSHIEQKLTCTFVRYNPDHREFHLGDVIHEIMTLIGSRKGEQYAESTT